MNSKGEICKIQGIFNVCRSVHLGLSEVLKQLQLPLIARKSPNGIDFCKWVHEVWSYILKMI